jgi:hypothetical protein
MEKSQGNSLYRYLKQTKMPFFFFYKIREQEARAGFSFLFFVEAGTSERGRM